MHFDIVIANPNKLRTRKIAERILKKLQPLGKRFEFEIDPIGLSRNGDLIRIDAMSKKGETIIVALDVNRENGYGIDGEVRIPNGAHFGDILFHRLRQSCLN